MVYRHIPVLLKEVLTCISLRAGEHVVDATLGGGGYTNAMAAVVGPAGKVLAIDLDHDALEHFKTQIANNQSSPAVLLVQGNFRDIAKIVQHHNFGNVSAIVADIGLSSYELTDAGRGISFQQHEPLDMRFDTKGPARDAKFILNQASAEELLTIVRKFGEEKFAKQIVAGIVRARAATEIRYTTDLVSIIQQSLPKPVQHKYKDSVRRVFQAIRIAVNFELENLEAFLPRAVDILAPGGRLAVVTFHSLEDRIVKNFFKDLARGCICPIEFPECRCGRSPQAKIITKKAIIPTNAEIERNPRSKSAKLRAIIKN